MLGVIFLIAAVIGLSRFAKKRGGNQLFWGLVAVAGYFVVPIVVSMVLLVEGTSERELGEMRYLLSLAAWSWLGIVFLYLRFVKGRRVPHSNLSWQCPSCLQFNQPHELVCSCGSRYADANLAEGGIGEIGGS